VGVFVWRFPISWAGQNGKAFLRETLRAHQYAAANAALRHDLAIAGVIARLTLHQLTHISAHDQETPVTRRRTSIRGST